MTRESTEMKCLMNDNGNGTRPLSTLPTHFTLVYSVHSLARRDRWNGDLTLHRHHGAGDGETCNCFHILYLICSKSALHECDEMNETEIKWKKAKIGKMCIGQSRTWNVLCRMQNKRILWTKAQTHGVRQYDCHSITSPKSTDTHTTATTKIQFLCTAAAIHFHHADYCWLCIWNECGYCGTFTIYQLIKYEPVRRTFFLFFSLRHFSISGFVLACFGHFWSECITSNLLYA